MEIADFKTFEEDYLNAAGAKFWGNIGAGILVYAKDTRKFLVAFRGLMANERFTYGIIGGKIDDEDNVDLEKEALKELDEEAGYTGNIKLTKISVFKKFKPGTKEIIFQYHTFLGVIDKKFEPKPHPEHAWENDHFEWVTYEELKKLEPKHFGLEYTLKHGKREIEKLIV